MVVDVGGSTRPEWPDGHSRLNFPRAPQRASHRHPLVPAGGPAERPLCVLDLARFRWSQLRAWAYAHPAPVRFPTQLQRRSGYQSDLDTRLGQLDLDQEPEILGVAVRRRTPSVERGLASTRMGARRPSPAQ